HVRSQRGGERAGKLGLVRDESGPRVRRLEEAARALAHRGPLCFRRPETGRSGREAARGDENPATSGELRESVEGCPGNGFHPGEQHYAVAVFSQDERASLDAAGSLERPVVEEVE